MDTLTAAPLNVVQFRTGSLRETTEAKISEFIRSKRNENTRKTYEHTLNEFFSFSRREFDEVEAGDIVEYTVYLEGRYKANTAVKKFAAVSSFFSYLVKTNAIGYNPTLAVRKPKPQPTIQDRIIDRETMLKLIWKTEETGTTEESFILKMLYYGAFRSFELLALRWEDTAIIGDNKARFFVRNGKGDKSRHVPIPLDKIPEFEELKKESGYLFTTKKGKPYQRTQLHRIIKRCCKRAGVNDDVSAHWLRHCHITHALDNGANIGVVSKIAGHSSFKVTSNYFHLLDDKTSADYL